jgi:hypothetical protein
MTCGPFLRVPRKGRVRQDGTKESNLYQPGWLALLGLLSANHWDQELRREACAVMSEAGRDGNPELQASLDRCVQDASNESPPSPDRSVQAVGTDMSRLHGTDVSTISGDKGIQGNKTRPAVEPPIEILRRDDSFMEPILATKEPAERSSQRLSRKEPSTTSIGGEVRLDSHRKELLRPGTTPQRREQLIRAMAKIVAEKLELRETA